MNDPVNLVDPDGRNPVLVAAGIGALVGASANLLGSYVAGTLTFSNAGQTALIGGVAGGAAVLTAGTSALVAATTLSELLAAELGAGLTGTFVGSGIDLGLTALLNGPDPYPQRIQPKKSCP